MIDLILLYGGQSGEHEISLISAASVLANLDASRYRIIPIGMDKEGCYYVNQYDELLSYEKSLPVFTNHSTRLDSLVINGRLSVAADVVFPMVHGPLYEDGCFQGLLEFGHIAYVGCDVLSSAIGMDKDMARRLVSLKGIKTTRYRLLPRQVQGYEKEQFCQQVLSELGLPLFVKPGSMGSSVGVHKVKNRFELLVAIDDARHYDQEVLIEETVKGREIELAVLESLDPSLAPDVSVAGEICVNHIDGFYSYTAKYLESEQTELRIPAQLEDKLLHRLQQAASDIFIHLKCKGMARVDFFVDDQNGDIYFNEINSLPGFTDISMYPKLWQVSGMTYSMLLDRLIDIALMHHHARQQLVRNVG